MTTQYLLNRWPELYVDYLNNFLTIEAWAEYYGMHLDHALDIIGTGRATDNFSKPLDWSKL